MRVGVTGHQTLRRTLGWRLVRSRIRSILDSVPPPVVGLSSLAIGADQMFAEEILRCDGRLDVVLPFDGYGDIVPAADRERFQGLLSEASSVVTLKPLGSREASYLRAGQYIVDHSDLVIAIWDGKAAAGIGGTADVVEYAKAKGRPIEIVDASEWR